MTWSPLPLDQVPADGRLRLAVRATNLPGLYRVTTAAGRPVRLPAGAALGLQDVLDLTVAATAAPPLEDHR